MKLATKILIAVLFISAIAVLGYFLRVFLRGLKLERQRKHNEERQRKQVLVDFWVSRSGEIFAAQKQFQSFLRRESGYFAYYLLRQWKETYAGLLEMINSSPISHLGLEPELEESIVAIQGYFNGGEVIRKRSNALFVPEEIEAFNGLFQNIEERCLDNQQKIAVVTDEDNNLVIAGAGSGKTTTIVGKVKYLQKKYSLLPDDILLISFTNKSAASLAERIKEEGFEALTFHKFGLRVITECDGVKPSIFDESQFPLLLKRYFEELSRDDKYLKNLTDYFVYYMKPPRSPFEFETKGAYIQYIKDENFRTYKPVPVNVRGIITLQREVVKSIEECLIANFLLFNGVEYEYERKYEFDTATATYQQYKPDFTIHSGGVRIYLEHFAISETDEIPTWFAKVGESYEMAKARYWEKIQWARELHRSNNTVLIETYSYIFKNETGFDYLEAQLLAHGVKLNPLTVEEKWNNIQEGAKDEIEAIITLAGTFITLLKSNNYAFSSLESKNEEISDSFTKTRNAAFLAVVKPLFERYSRELIAKNEIDFSDMINQATELIKSKRYPKSYKYIIVDEFQDISIGRYGLLQAIKSADPATRLFCVGDDWQSIYRFTGSDIALFKNFPDYFGVTAKSTIETTYRYAAPLLTMSNDFLIKNPNQSTKVLRSLPGAAATQYFFKNSFSEDGDDTLALIEAFQEILNKGNHGQSILILGRYSFDIKRLKNQAKALEIDAEKGSIRYSHLTPGGAVRSLFGQFMTVHKAKGLEAEVVIILNCNAGRFGFPAGLSDDSVLNLLLSEADQFENGEERRLFYVAMTRAKRAVYFIADAYRKSKFVLELEADQNMNRELKCPECKTADLVLRKTGTAKSGSPYKFYGCSNYLFGCGYTNTVFHVPTTGPSDNRRGPL